MRLIDATALLHEIDFIPSTMSVCLTMEECEGRIDMKHDCERVIEQMPTIDAIPVEWLRKARNDDRLTIDDVETIDLILAWWQKEQEGKHAADRR